MRQRSCNVAEVGVNWMKTLNVPILVVHTNWSVSFRSFRIWSCWTLYSLEAVSATWSNEPPSVVNVWSSFPNSKRASATIEGKERWYNQSNLCALSASSAIFVGFDCSVDPPGTSDCFWWEKATTTWKSGTRRRTSRASSFRLLDHCPSSSSSSRAIATFRSSASTAWNLTRHFVKARAVQCWTKPDEDKRPLEKWILVCTDGRMFSIMADKGGGVGW